MVRPKWSPDDQEGRKWLAGISIGGSLITSGASVLIVAAFRARPTCIVPVDHLTPTVGVSVLCQLYLGVNLEERHMKLNAGSVEGTKGYDGDFVNLDLLRPHKGVQGDILSLPFKDNAFEEVRLIHVLEHVLRPQQIPVLRELHRVVKPGGVLFVEVPDFLENMIDMVRAYQSRPPDWSTDWEEIRIRTMGVFGKQRTAGDAHHWGYNENYLTKQLQRFPWKSVVRSTEMISGHWRAENVILMKCVK